MSFKGYCIDYFKNCFTSGNTFKLSLIGLSIDDTLEQIRFNINKLIKKINNEEISNRVLGNILTYIGEKKIKGENRNEEMKNLIISLLLENYKYCVEMTKTIKSFSLLKNKLIEEHNCVTLMYDIIDKTKK